MDKSKIEWTDATWNPVTGCTKVSEGCRNCYAERMSERLRAMGSANYKNGFELTLQPHMLDQPIRWKKPRMVFVNSMSDLFHPDVSDMFIGAVFAVMGMARQHTFQILTKRPKRMMEWMENHTTETPWRWWADEAYTKTTGRETPDPLCPLPIWPLRNVWLGVSVEDQKTASERIPLLLSTPAARRFISAEPLLGKITFLWDVGRFLDWVICGGESGPGARPMNLRWARSMRDQCETWGIPFFFKQWGEFNADGERVGKKKAGDLLDGVQHHNFPTALTSKKGYGDESRNS